MENRAVVNEIEELLLDFPVVALIGPRQVGKTTVAKSISRASSETIYLDLESPADNAKLREPELFFAQNQTSLIIIDEIQRMPELFPVIRSFVDRTGRNGQFLLLGSATPSLIKDSGESLAGRIAYCEMPPFTVSELVSEDMMKHWLRGGFPKSLLARSNPSSMTWRKNFIRTYLEKDLPQLGLSADPVLIGNLWKIMAHSHGSLLNSEMLSGALGVKGQTVAKYLRFMENAFLLYSLQPFHANLKKRLVRSPKIYIRDSGILHALLNIGDAESLSGHPVLGFSWEGYVISQIYLKLRGRRELYFYRTHQGSECDLVIANGGIPEFSIEIKYTSAPFVSKGFRISTEDLGTKNNFIITPSSDSYLISQNIRVCNLKEFLSVWCP